MIEYIIEGVAGAADIEYALSIDGTILNLGTPTATPFWDKLENGDPIIGGETYRVYWRYISGDWQYEQYKDYEIPTDPADTDIVGAMLGLTVAPEESAPATIAAWQPNTIDGVTVFQLVQITLTDLNTQLGNIITGSTATGHYTHTQTTASATWTITHSLGFRPAGILVEDSTGQNWFFDADHTSANELVLTFGGRSFAGIAYLS